MIEMRCDPRIFFMGASEPCRRSFRIGLSQHSRWGFERNLNPRCWLKPSLSFHSYSRENASGHEAVDFKARQESSHVDDKGSFQPIRPPGMKSKSPYAREELHFCNDPEYSK